jgi:D-arabinose 1-dehydrogenase-like Zn-dependent alcohol dehydrogenase
LYLLEVLLVNIPFFFCHDVLICILLFLGAPEESEEMLKLVSEKNIKAWVETYPMDQVNEAIEGFRAGKPRFRYVLKN